MVWPVFGFTFGSASMEPGEVTAWNPLPSILAMKIRQHTPAEEE